MHVDQAESHSCLPLASLPNQLRPQASKSGLDSTPCIATTINRGSCRTTVGGLIRVCQSTELGVS